MSRKAQEKQEAPRTLPSVAEIEEALAWFCARAQKPVTTTFILKARKPSCQTKVPQLLDKHIYVTNLKHRILEHYRERLDRQRDDGAIALVLRAQQLGKGRDQALGEIIEKEYVRPGLTDEDYRYHARLRQDTCTDVARILIAWVQKITGTVLSRATLKTDEDKAKEKAQHAAEPASTQAPPAPRKKQKRSAIRRLSRQKRDHPMMMEEAYAAWKQKRQRWERTAAIPIPFGRHKETPLGDIGRREARWLMERLLPMDEIQKTLEFVEHLIQNPDARTEEIAYEEHPYVRDSGREFKHRRAVHANRLLQRLLDPPGDSVVAGTWSVATPFPSADPLHHCHATCTLPSGKENDHQCLVSRLRAVVR
jgi:hypothetical protein